MGPWLCFEAEAYDLAGADAGAVLGTAPGMDAGDDREAYDVLLVRRSGATEVFAQH